MRSDLVRICGYGFGVMTILVAVPSYLLAGTPTAAPEIDVSSISAAVGVVAAGVLILRSRHGSK
jgi:hypothetical protein